MKTYAAKVRPSCDPAKTSRPIEINFWTVNPEIWDNFINKCFNHIKF